MGLDVVPPKAAAAFPTTMVTIVGNVQTGYVNSVATSTSTNEDLRFVNVTISAVTNTARCLVILHQGDQPGGQTLTGRLTSTTNLRIATNVVTATLSTRWYVVEFQ